MTQTNQPQTKHDCAIDQKKVDKLFPTFLNGEDCKLETRIPLLISTSNIIDRERYDHRDTVFRKHEPSKRNTELFLLLQAIEDARKAKTKFTMLLIEYKQSVNECYEKHKTPRL
jgi:hypothetical protein